MAGGIRRYDAQAVDIAGVALDYPLEFVFLLCHRLPEHDVAVSATCYNNLALATHEGAATTDVIAVPNQRAGQVVRHFISIRETPNCYRASLI